MTERRLRLSLPPNLFVLLGASTAGYALLLAGVAGLQSRAEASLAAAREPAVSGIEDLAAGHDALRARLDATRDAYAGAVDTLLAATDWLDRLDAELATFAGLVTEIDGTARRLPDRVKIPPVQRSVSQVRMPATQATTGASGG